jgi:hypothetical protein
MAVIYVPRAFGGTLILTVTPAAPSVPPLVVPAIFRSGGVVAFYRSGEEDAEFRNGEEGATFRNGVEGATYRSGVADAGGR